MKASKLTQKGQITLPKAMRDAMGWGLETPLTFVKCDDGVKIIEVPRSATSVIESMMQVEWQGPTYDEIKAETRSEV